MIDYYAVTMPTMIALMSIIAGLSCFSTERQYKTINRLMIAPVNQVKLFLAKILGTLPQALMQMAIMMIISVLLYKARYSDSLAGNLYLFLMFFLVSFASISVGAAAGIVFKKNIAPVFLAVVCIMMFFAGTFSNGLYIEGVTDVMPAYLIHEAAFDLTIMGKYGRIHGVNLVCIAIIAVMLIIGAAAFKRKEKEG
jgi:ABC-2 type transport system permease protein